MIWVAFTLGLLGSLHCLGMCGPLVMSVCSSDQHPLRQSILYHSGRITAYALLGVIFGSLSSLIMLAGVQKALSLFMGLLFIGLFLRSTDMEHLLHRWSWFRAWSYRLSNMMMKVRNVRSTRGILSLGFLNGLLPCGLVYLAIAGALATSDTLLGVFFMVAFGLGTLPIMLGLIIADRRVANKHLRYSFRKLLPYVHLAFGLFLMYRGLVVDMPAEIDFWTAVRNPIMCH